MRFFPFNVLFLSKYHPQQAEWSKYVTQNLNVWALQMSAYISGFHSLSNNNGDYYFFQGEGNVETFVIPVHSDSYLCLVFGGFP